MKQELVLFAQFTVKRWDRLAKLPEYIQQVSQGQNNPSDSEDHPLDQSQTLCGL